MNLSNAQECEIDNLLKENIWNVTFNQLIN